LIPGLGVAAAVVTAAAALLIFARIGAIHGPTLRLYLATNRGAGVIPGTEVWLDGVKVGAVRWIRFQPPTADTTRRLLIALDVKASVRPRLRRDTRAKVEPGGSQLGAPVVQLFGAGLFAPPIADGDTMISTGSRQLREAREQIAIAAQSLPIVVRNIEAVRDQVVSQSGTIGALGSEQDVRSMRTLRMEASQLIRDTGYQGGTIALVSSASFAARVRGVIARGESLVRRATAPGGTAPVVRARRDLARSLSQVDAELSMLDAQLQQVHGPSAVDSTERASLREQISQTRDRLHSLTADIAHRPLRYMDF
jgi:hypothetical protein